MTTSNRAPVITLIVVALNIAAAYGLLVRPELLFSLGYDPAAPQFWMPITSLFLHQNVVHLLGNMVFLAAVGPRVEEAAGPWRFLLVYVAGGLAGVFAHALFTPKGGAPMPLIGASGSVAACIAYYNIRYVGLQVTLAPKIGVPILAITILWVALQLLGAFVSLGGEVARTAYWAHLGGFAAGLGFAALFRARRDADRQMGHVVMDRLEKRSPAAKLAASDLHLAEHPADVAALLKKADAHAQLGDRDHEAEALLQALEHLPESGQPDLLARLIGIGQIQRLPSLRRTLLAERFRVSHADLAKGLLLSVVAGSPEDPQRPEALLALATMGESSYLQELREKFSLHPACDLARARGLL
ncbi:MAG: rhomboid family intramembrane serine protease [Methanoregulaceae archaeon]|nr:rhomboid family intramembrane serine protease [Methanoregulaceae archaeon]